MRVLHVHNFYQLPGGEDQCFVATGAILEKYGHEVIRYTLHNNTISGMGALVAARKAIWNKSVHDELRRLIRRERPDVAHFENTFPLVSPAAYHACHVEAVPVVQTIHNFRIVCLSGAFYRSGGVCEKCLGRKFAWPGILRGCYRSSHLGSAVVAAMIKTHHLLGSWEKGVDAYVALNRFVQEKMIQAGLGADKVYINPCSLTSDPGIGDGDGGYALFAGRLSPEKGIGTLLAAWRELALELPLKILGDGPEAHQVAETAARHPNIEWLGWRPAEEVLALIGGAKCVVVPSLCYETFNRTQLEAFAKGTPVVASRHGSMRAFVEHCRTGLLFTPNDPDDLIRQVRWLLDHPAAYNQMRLAARREFESRYTDRVSHDGLMQIYNAAREHMHRKLTIETKH